MAMLRLPLVFAAAALAVALALGMAAAQGPAAAPGPAPGISPECMNAVFNMSDCLTYVTAGSTARQPDKPCCPELAGLLESHPVCLCQLLAGGAESYGVSVDYKRALALPGICRLNAPPVGACAVFGVPVPMGMVPSAAPMSGLSPSSNGPEVPANTPSGSAKSSNHAPGRFTAGGLVALVALPLAVTAAAGMF
ncbi:non-specific lipid transfer protein GPI-anchored 2-like [Phragmites australis]|uniref:non-specific lipid transfer protein GPI-anchored 2-like n=1 Tax=Phragmites australis TaxID=29695 RepID=UPI002D775A78|nr:non-specific lipid transfer protein GPI-anchored 2-like [Phragmites australis]